MVIGGDPYKTENTLAIIYYKIYSTTEIVLL